MAVKFLNGIDVVGSMNITANDIPDHSARKITSDTLDAARIPDLSGTYQPVGNYLTSIPSEYLTQTEGDARYLQSLPSHNHNTLYDAIGSAEAVQTFVNEQNFATDAAISTAVSNYLPLSGGTLSGNLTVGAVGKTSDTVVRSLADQSYKAGFEAYGNGQGTGYVYVGQSLDYGGGFSYNGDNSPGFIGGETADNITFFRRQAGTNTEVFHYAYSNNDVYFNGAVVASGSNSNNWNTAYGWGNHASAGYLTSIPSSYATDAEVNSAVSVVNDRIDTEILPSIPTNNNQLTNGAGYLTTSGKAADSNLLDGIDSSGFVRAYGTSNDNIDADWGQSFKTFDPVPSGTPPIASPNLRTINVGENFARRTQIAFDYATDRAWFRRRHDSTWRDWKEFYHTGNLSLATLGYTGATNANYITNNNQLTNGAGYATTSYVNTAVSNLVASAPAALDTLNELAAALGDDANFSTTVANSIGAIDTRIDTEVLPAIDAKQNAGNYFTDGDTVLNMANNDGLVYNDTNNTMYIKKDGTDYAIIDAGGGTITGTLNLSGGGTKISMNNGDITGVNQILINDPGEGIVWTNGSSGNMALAIRDDASDNTLNLTGTGAALAINGLTVATQSWVGAQNYLTSIPSTYATDAEVNTAVSAVDSRIDTEVLPSIPTNNNQLTNGAGYITSYVNTTYTAGSGLQLSGTTFKLNGGEIPGGVDLNTYRTTGIYAQNSNADTTSGSNWPTNFAGILEVWNDDYGNGIHCTQRYSRYNTVDVYQRNYYNGTWTSWRNLTQDTNTTYSTSDFDAAGSAATAQANAIAHADDRIETEVLPAIPTNNNQLTNGAGYTTNTGTITGVSTGTGLDGTASSGAVTITLDLSELTDMTAAVSPTADELILLDNGAERKKRFSEIFGSAAYQASSAFDAAGTGAAEAGAVKTWVQEQNYASDAAINTAIATVTLSSLGYTGATNANYITNNNQLTNGAGYATEDYANTSAFSYSSLVNDRIDTEVLPAIPTNNNQLTNGAGYITAVPSSFSTNTITIGGGVTLTESTDRADLLMIKSSTSTWGGLQISNTSNEIIFSMMGDGTTGGIYDDQNSDWLIQWTENAGVRLYHNAGEKLTTTSTGVSITGALVASGDVTAFSDARIKENVETLPNALDKVKSMRGVTYNKIGEEKQSVGVIAQELEEVVPQLVHTDEDGMKSVAYGNITAVLIEALKEQQAQIEELKSRLDGLTK